MNLKLDCLIGKEILLNNFEEVEKKIKKYGQVIILGKNKAVYQMSLVNLSDIEISKNPKRARVTLVEAMIQILSCTENNIMHAKDLAEEITDKELYFMKYGSNVSAVQIRARANNNLDKFECLPGNFIKLKWILDKNA